MWTKNQYFSWFDGLAPVAGEKLLNSDVCHDDIDSVALVSRLESPGDPMSRTWSGWLPVKVTTGTSRQSSYKDRWDQWQSMLDQSQPSLAECCQGAEDSVIFRVSEMVVVMARKWQVLFLARGHGWMFHWWEVWLLVKTISADRILDNQTDTGRLWGSGSAAACRDQGWFVMLGINTG